MQNMDRTTQKAIETERLQAVMDALTPEHLHKVYVYARTLAQIEISTPASQARRNEREPPLIRRGFRPTTKAMSSLNANIKHKGYTQRLASGIMDGRYEVF